MIPAAEMTRDECRASFDQPPGQKRALPPRMPAIAFADFGILLRQIERLPRLLAGDQLVGLAIKAIDRVELAAAIDLVPELIEIVRQAAAILQPIECELRCQAQVLDLELVVVRIALGLERILL